MATTNAIDRRAVIAAGFGSAIGALPLGADIATAQQRASGSRWRRIHAHRSADGGSRVRCRRSPSRFLRSASACAVAVSMTVGPLSTARAVEPLDPYQWTFLNPTSVSSIPLPEVAYTATNERNSGILGYHERRYGINLSWVGSAGTGQWTFRRVGGQGQILAHEAVALRNNMTGDYVRYGSREYGINLKWSSRPVYEWHVGERDGHISLFNITHGDYVVYGSRRYGINLRWREDVNNPRPRFGTRTTTVFLARQSPAFPSYFVRRFGVGFSGRLLSVRHVTRVRPNIDAQALFLKPGRSSSDCKTPAAVVALGRGKTLTKAEMRQVFGDDEPRLPVRFRACIKTVAATPTTIDLDIKYVRAEAEGQRDRREGQRDRRDRRPRRARTP